MMTHSHSVRKDLMIRTAFLFCVLLASSYQLCGEAVRSVTFSPHTKYSCQMNMGPTGARAWMRGHHFVVMSIDHGSPADGPLELADVVTGANGTPFNSENDPRMTLGNAIGQSEAEGKPLQLSLLRGKKEVTTEIHLSPLGALGKNWPYDCEKSAKILDTACRTLLHIQLPSGEIVTDGDMGTLFGGLLMLASNNPKYLDGARRAAYYVADKEREPGKGINNWTDGYGALLLAEYYLATGDDAVLADLQIIVDLLCEGQMKSGGWGHGSPHGAYGTLNQPGIICAIALTLSKECGLKVNPLVHEKALKLFSRYAELGAVPYGDHMPRGHLDGNGRNASSAILMHLNDLEHERDAFASSVSASYWEREEGHTGGYFSILYGPLGTALLGQDALRPFLDFQKWYYNLSRTWKGELTILPYYEALTRFDDSTYNYFGGEFTTGGIGLLYALPHKHLRILGAPRSIYAKDADVTGELKHARQAYLDRQWSDFDHHISKISPAELKNEQEKIWLQQLISSHALRKAATDRVLLEIESNLTEGVPYRSSLQFQALKRSLGEDADSRFEKIEEFLAARSWHINEGKMYHEAWRELRVFNYKSWVPQGHHTKMMMEGTPPTSRPIWEPLSPTSSVTPQSWSTLLIKDGKSLPQGWMNLDFNDSSWKTSHEIYSHYDALIEGLDEKSQAEKINGLTREDRKKLESQGVAARRAFVVEDPKGVALRIRLRTVRPAHTKVYLNGHLITNAVRGQRGGYATIPLHTSNLNILKEGTNLLAVTSDSQSRGRNKLDVGLEIQRDPMELRSLPTHRPSALVLEDLPDVDNTMRVRNAKDRKLAEIEADYRAMPIDDLVEQLGRSVAFFRAQAITALSRRGEAAVEVVIPLLDSQNWKVKSSACEVLEKILKGEEDIPPTTMKLIQSQIPVLTKLLSDPHHWVRVRACICLGELGSKGHISLPWLTELISDQHPWVREAAIRTIVKLEPIPEIAIAAAHKALVQSSTSFSAPKQAMIILKKYPELREGRLDAIMTLLRNTPQGMGGGVLNTMLEMAVELDPEGETMIPFLTLAIDGKTGLSQQQANPPARALKLLGDYGTKATSAESTLYGILESDSKADKNRHEAVKEVLMKIQAKP